MSPAPRLTLCGFGGAVAAGHYLAAEAGARILAEGGNAADAACAMGVALQVLEPHLNGPAGEVPILVYEARPERIYAISGQGPAPEQATPAALQELGIELIPPDGFLGATVPAAWDAWCLLLERFGRLSLERVLAPARALAERGFPMYEPLRSYLRALEPRFREEWPGSAALYLPVRELGEAQTNPAFAELLAQAVAVERRSGSSREARIRAARDDFYRGRPAEQIERFVAQPVRDVSGRAHAGLLRAQDLARYRGSLEEPVACDYRGARVWKCPPWSQGPVFLQQLRLLEGFDLTAMGGASVDALHTWIECAKLAYADREACYGDPRFVKVPLDELLSDAYSARRRGLIDADHASLELRPGMGRLPAGWPRLGAGVEFAEPQARAARLGRSDTTHLDAVDREGNLVSATPSGAWIPSSPVIPELGFPLGTRGQMFVLDPEHPNVLAPGKRPRTTLTPSLAQLPDGRRLAFGTPGGDQQDQWSLQFFLNGVDFGLTDLQRAIDAPSAHSLHMPSSFYPREAQLGVVALEARLSPDVVAGLRARGHRVRQSGPWDHRRLCAVAHLPRSGACEAAASTRGHTAHAIALA